MNDIVKIREVRAPEIIKTERGKQRERIANGRWSVVRVAEYIQQKNYFLSMDDIARFVYGSTTATRRDNVRKHIPTQRRYMLERDLPFVTKYGPRGRILMVKIYDSNKPDDKAMLQVELDKAREKKEISERRYDDLTRLFLLKDR